MRKAEHIPLYLVSDDGVVYSSSHNWRGYGERQLAQSLNSDGYQSVRLSLSSGKRVRFSVHRIVATLFLGLKPSARHEVRHLDGNKTNNHITNLSWGTAKENAEDRERHGRTSRGDSHSERIKAGLEKAEIAAIAKAKGE